MHLTSFLLLIVLPLFPTTILARPTASSYCQVETITHTVTKTVRSASSSTSVAPITSPTAPYTVISARSGSPIHLLQLNAADQSFYLGGQTESYCPLTNTSLCPLGLVTAFLGLGALDTLVPGGQQVYVAPDGHLGFTEAHSISYPPGSIIGPLTYVKSSPNATFGDLSTNAFGATGFMACPVTTEQTGGMWQVFANLPNATVPSGKVADCLGFDALTEDYTGTGPAAWEYV